MDTDVGLAVASAAVTVHWRVYVVPPQVRLPVVQPVVGTVMV